MELVERLIDNPAPLPGVPVMGVVNRLPGAGIPDDNWLSLRRPYLDPHGRACVELLDLDGGFTRNDSTGGEPKPLRRGYLVNDLRARGMSLPPVCNAVSIYSEAWREIEATVQRSYRQRLRAAADLESRVPVQVRNWMGKMVYTFRAMSDPGEAVVDMDAVHDGRNDRPLGVLRSVPLPLTHSDFGYTLREREVSRSGNMALDEVDAEAGARRCAEMIEDTVIGNVTGATYGGLTAGPDAITGNSTVYGFANYPNRLTKTNFTVPGSGGWVPDTSYNEILAALEQLRAQFSYGPFVIYHSTDWTPYMARVYAVAGGNNAGETLRTMLLKNEDIAGVERLDRLTSTFTLFIVSMNRETVGILTGFGPTTVQWDEKGGLDLRLKIIVGRAPIFRADYSNRVGVLHGTTA